MKLTPLLFILAMYSIGNLKIISSWFLEMMNFEGNFFCISISYVMFGFDSFSKYLIQNIGNVTTKGKVLTVIELIF